MVTLRQYQEQGKQTLLNWKRGYLTDEPGLGKTVTIVDTLREANAFPALIVANKGAAGRWEEEALAFGFEPVIYQGTSSQRVRALKLFLTKDRGVLITNYKLLKELLEKTQEFKIPWRALVCDEIHMKHVGLLSHKTDTYDSVKQMSRLVEYFYLLTGTPIRKDPSDLYAPLSLIAPKSFSSYWRFVNKYCMVWKEQFGISIDPQPKDVAELRDLLQHYMVRRTKQHPEVAKEIPDKTRVPIKLQLRGEQKRVYNELVEANIAEIGDSFLVTANAAARITRLRQLLVCPRILGIDDDGAALEMLTKHLIGEFDGNRPVAVFTPFAQALPFIEQKIKKLGAEVYTIHGQLNASLFKQRWQAFQHSTSKRSALLCTIDSATSFDAYRAASSYFLGSSWSAIDNIQAEDRLQRIGQKSKVLAYYYLYEDTTDDRIREVLNDKQKASNWVLHPNEVLRELKRI